MAMARVTSAGTAIDGIFNTVAFQIQDEELRER